MLYFPETSPVNSPESRSFFWASETCFFVALNFAALDLAVELDELADETHNVMKRVVKADDKATEMRREMKKLAAPSPTMDKVTTGVKLVLTAAASLSGGVDAIGWKAADSLANATVASTLDVVSELKEYA